MFRIGIQYNNYPEIRNIIGVIDDATYIMILSKADYVSQIVKKINKFYKIRVQASHEMLYSFKSKDNLDIDFFHFFNSILYGSNNWGVTFESVVPFHEELKIGQYLRGEKVFFKDTEAVKRLYSSNCKFIIAISECTFNLQMEYLNHFPLFKNIIVKKMHVMHPPQKVLMTKYVKPNIANGINFMLVGRELLSKGGIEVLRVFDKIKDTYQNFTLTLIGDFKESNNRYLLTEYELEELLSIIENNKGRINYYKSLPNHKVLKTMIENIHVGLLPTHADTYGYSVLEFQSAGCPVITTNIRALPEINNNKCGWLIDVPKSGLGEPFSKTDKELKVMQETIEKQLLSVMCEILNKPSSIIIKGINSIERVKENHCPLNHSNKLRDIYNESITTVISFGN
ncbi:MAG: glycosyltransferase family 4 protein [Paludibacter sp.]|nr:glycosyltransferase family 4 protein [Paludibacter sp.]